MAVPQPEFCANHDHTGGSERIGGCHPFHHECPPGVSNILADIQYYGSESVCWKILPLH